MNGNCKTKIHCKVETMKGLFEILNYVTKPDEFTLEFSEKNSLIKMARRTADYMMESDDDLACTVGNIKEYGACGSKELKHSNGPEQREVWLEDINIMPNVKIETLTTETSKKVAAFYQNNLCGKFLKKLHATPLKNRLFPILKVHLFLLIIYICSFSGLGFRLLLLISFIHQS